MPFLEPFVVGIEINIKILGKTSSMLKKNPFSTPSEILHHSLEFIKSHNIQQDVIVLVSVPSYKKTS